MKSRIAYPFVILALWGAVWAADPLRVSRADGAAQFELTPSHAVSPDAGGLAEEDHLIAELSTHYADCLDRAGSEELCYRRWYRECKARLPGKCALLEEQMYPAPRPGDESC